MKIVISQSIIDRFIDLFPGMEITSVIKKPSVDSKAAMRLFSIWRDEKNKVGKRLYKRPMTIPVHEIDSMKEHGLVKSIGDKLEITQKGSDVIKVMILGDNSSIFEDKGIIVSYDKALATAKEASTRKAKKMDKQASDSWWSRY